MVSIKVGRSLAIFALTLLIYGLRAGDLLRHESVAPYFLNLADAFLHGKVNIENPPAWGYDLIWHNEKWYVAQQPLPALLLMPVVSILGINRVSDVAIGVLCGAMSVMLADVVLRLTTPDITLSRLNLIVLFFALGTVHFSLSVLGTVWFLGQVVTILFVWMLIWAAWQNRPSLAGVTLGLILLGRPSIMPGVLLFAVSTWQLCRPNVSRRDRLTFWSQFFVPITAAIIFLGWYNWARFGSPLETGYAYIQESSEIKARFLQFGNFNLVFLPENLFIATLKPPLIHLHCLHESCPLFEPHPLGMGLIWVSPVLLYGVLALRLKGRHYQQNMVLAASTGLALLPSLLYHNSGSAQFAYRFLLDGLPFWLILVARGIKYQPLSGLLVLVLYSMAVNIWGTNWLIAFIT